MQRLVDVADETNEKGELTGGTPLVVIPITKALRVLIDFGRDAVPLWAPLFFDPNGLC
jgi:hypothetical protein